MYSNRTNSLNLWIVQIEHIILLWSFVPSNCWDINSPKEEKKNIIGCWYVPSNCWDTNSSKEDKNIIKGWKVCSLSSPSYQSRMSWSWNTYSVLGRLLMWWRCNYIIFKFSLVALFDWIMCRTQNMTLAYTCH